jgi:hypothetical protein
MAKYSESRNLSASDMLTAVRAAYRLGILDALLVRAKQPGTHPSVRAKLEGERQRRLEELRDAGISEAAFEQEPTLVEREQTA